MGMEPYVKDFLLRIVNTISMALIWLLLNMSIGIYFGFAFFEDKPTMGNYIFYACFIISFVFLLLYLRKKWKGWKEIGEE